MRMLRRTCRGASAGRYRPSRGGERESRWPEGPRRRSLQGCHTILIGGYTVEGHVPVAAVERLLVQKPAVRGIALPGMPTGSPGMGGVQAAPFRVMSFGAQGRSEERRVGKECVGTCRFRWAPEH